MKRHPESLAIGAHAVLQCAVACSITTLPLRLSAMGPSGGALAGWTSVAIGAGLVASVIATPLWGVAGDRIGVRQMALRAGLGLAFAQLLMVFAREPWQLVAARVVQGGVSGVEPALLALAARLTPTAQRGRAMGRMDAAATIASLIGPLLSGAISSLADARWAFAAAWLLSVCGVAICTHVRAPGPALQRRPSPALQRQPSPAPHADSESGTSLAVWLAIGGVATAGSAALGALLPVIALERAVIVPGPTLAAGVRISSEVAYLAVLCALGRVIDRRGALAVSSCCLLVAAIAVLLLRLSSGEVALLVFGGIARAAASSLGLVLYTLSAAEPSETGLSLRVSSAGSVLRAGGALGCALLAPVSYALGIQGILTSTAVMFLLLAVASPLWVEIRKRYGRARLPHAV